MSRTVDERVVSMKFDNRQFEKNISTTMSSVEKFNKTLNMTGASKGLENVADSARKFDMSGMASAVETVSSKFSALEVMGVTALMNITNSAVNAGKRILSALTIDPVKTGFNEYELKMGSIQTIMAGTGESLETVNKYLEELNEYSDKTIYSFSDMTSNIGKFTNAGVKLEDAVAAIKGVSNVAALSGANANEASRAMYNFSQALSSGYVKLIDWKSIENANMATVGFKEQLIEAAVAAGTLTETSDGMYKTIEGTVINATKNFNDSLQDQWMTTEVLISTLKEYTDETTEIGKKATAAAQDVKTLSMLFDTLKESAQSGWAQTWEILVGDFEEGKKLWTDVNNAISPILEASANARNELLKTWKELGGRTQLLEALRSAFAGIMNISSTVKEAFGEIFEKIKPEQLLKLSEGIKKFADGFKAITENVEVMDKLKRTAKGLFAIFDIGVEIVKAIWSALKQLVGYIFPVGDGFLSLTAGLGDSLVALRDWIKSGNVFGKVFGGIAGIVVKAVEGFKKALSFIKSCFTSWTGIELSMETFTEKFKARLEQLTKIGEWFKDVFSSIGGFFKKIGDALAPVISVVKNALSTFFNGIGDAIKSFTENADFNTVLDLTNTGLLGAILIGVGGFVKNLTKITKDGDGALNTIKDFFKTFTSVLKDGNLNGLKKMLTDIGKEVLAPVKEALVSWQNSLKADILLKIAKAIAILAAALFVLALLDSKKLTVALAAITGLFIDLFASMAIFQKVSGKMNFGKLAATLIGVSAAILILSFAMANLAKLDWEGLAVGLTGIAALSAVLVGLAAGLGYMSKVLVKTEKQTARMSAMVGQLLGLSVALLLLSFACRSMAKLSWEELAKGLGGMTVAVAGLALALKYMPKTSALSAGGIVVAAVGLAILAGALKLIGLLKMEELAKGLFAIVACLGALAIALRLMQGTIVGSAALLISSVALLAFAGALKVLGLLSWEEVLRGLVAIGGCLVVLAVGLTAMIASLPGAAALIVASVALAVLAPVLMILGRLSWEAIAKGLVAIAGSLAVLGVAGLVLAPILPIILGLSVAIALVGAGCLASAVSISLLSVALGTLAVALASLGVGMTAFAGSILAIIPLILAKVGEGIVGLVVAIGGGLDQILTVVRDLLIRLIGVLNETIPHLTETVVTLLVTILDTVNAHMPQIIALGMQILTSFVQGIANDIQPLVEAAIDLINNFLAGIASKIPDIIQAGFDLIISFIDGLATAIDNNTDRIITAGENLFDSLVNAGLKVLKAPIDKFKQTGKNIIEGLIQGIKGKVSDVVKAAKGVVSDALEGAKKLLGIHSPSKAFAEVGRYADEGLIVGLKKFAGSVSKAAGGVGTSALDALSKPLSTISDVIDGNIDVQPTVRPVIDLTDVQKGAKTLNGLFSNSRALSVSASINGGIDEENQNRTRSSTNGNVYQFTQNNYSPKSLSRIDIYRQTKNQFSALEREVALND